MNQRILELISQAQKEVWGNNPYNGSPEFEGYELDSEKFAELIVRECAQFVEDTFDFVGEEIIVKEKMLNHFGVE